MLFRSQTFSKAKDADAWKKSWNEMAKKTVIRRHSKRWPLSGEIAAAFSDEAEERPQSFSRPSLNGGDLVEVISKPEPEIDDGEGTDLGPQGSEPNSAPADAPPKSIAKLTAEAMKVAGTIMKGPEPNVTSAELARIVTEAGFTFDHFQKFMAVSGNHEDPSSLTGFDALSPDLAKRLIRAKVGLLRELANIKEGK